MFRRMPHLKLKLLPNLHEVLVDIAEGRSPDDDLQDLLNRSGRFDSDWVEVKAATGGDVVSRYVRYDQIVEVSAHL